jgi:putative ABC transport system permease protein
LLSRDFGKLVLISFIVAVPFAWYMISRWLVSFEYKTSIGWEIYLIVGFVAFAIAGVSIGYQAIRAALSNPADIIKSE